MVRRSGHPVLRAIALSAYRQRIAKMKKRGILFDPIYYASASLRRKPGEHSRPRMAGANGLVPDWRVLRKRLKALDPSAQGSTRGVVPWVDGPKISTVP